MDEMLLPAEEHVLSTLDRDGSRRWLKPKLSPGRFWSRRRWVAYVLIAVFTLLPFVKLNGRPLFLLDIPTRHFTIFGHTFLPTDAVLLALFLVIVLLSIFLLTALWGRIWCGWACPQTVYLEFVFRPIERLLEGTSGRGGPRKKAATWRTVVKYGLFFLVSLHLANTFLAYFVGVDRLAKWTTQSPIEHPLPFLIVAAVTGLMMFDFCYFREQLCIIACPYGRFQSVLLDQHSLIVSYDQRRGEPRGRKTKTAATLPVVGDCVDCRLCVTTCPTGIDIRQGLQMECINCTQCMDACDAVMQRIGRKPGLIRYSSQAEDRGQRGTWLRARTWIYPLFLVIAIATFAVAFQNQRGFQAVILREPGSPDSIGPEGMVQNLFRLKLTNREPVPAQLQLRMLEPASAAVQVTEESIALAPFETSTFHVQVLCPADVFRNGLAQARMQINDAQNQTRELKFKLIGPYTLGTDQSETDDDHSPKEKETP